MNAKQKQQALDTINGLMEGRMEVFHSPDAEPFIRAQVEDHRENFPLKKDGRFKDWAHHLYFVATGSAFPKEIYNQLVDQLQAQAKFGAPEYQTPRRVAEYNGRIYVDLCNDKWQVVEITSTGWRVISEPPVRFRRSPGMLALPVPESGGSVQDLFRYINIKTPADRALILAWLLATYRPTGPYPILALHGEQGSAKTTTETILRRMIDPATANLSGVPRDERDLLISVRHSHLLGFDNFSKISDSLSDTMCRIATGSGLTTRKLYTDDVQTIFSGCRPILLNGITDLATRGDLLDRMIVLFLPKIQDTERREERALMREFEAAQPKILGAMLDAVSVALREYKNISFPNLPRMADFAAWAAAGAKALGFEPQELIAAYEQNRVEANFIALDNAPAAIEIFKWAAHRTTPWEGTCQNLLTELNLQTAPEIQKDQQWPKSARGLSAVLTRSAPNLAAAGVIVTKLPREAGTGQRKYRIESSHRHNQTFKCPECEEPVDSLLQGIKHGRQAHNIPVTAIADWRKRLVSQPIRDVTVSDQHFLVPSQRHSEAPVDVPAIRDGVTVSSRNSEKGQQYKCPECGEQCASLSQGIKHGKTRHNIDGTQVKDWKTRLQSPAELVMARAVS